MNVGLIAHNEKKNLIEDFCLAHKRIFGKASTVCNRNYRAQD